MDRLEQQLSDDPKEALIELLTSQLSTLKRKREALKSQIDQTNMIVDREQSRNADLASELQTIQSNLGTVPREDIRDKYNEALDVRTRLATMRGQLEKFESQYEYLAEEQEILAQVLHQFQDVELADEEGSEEGDSRGALNVVRIVQAQEEERKRLAGQMHDGPAQSLTNFILQAEICQKLFDRNPDRAREELDNLKENASATFQKVRDFIFDLRPMMLDDLGVVPTVKRYVDTFREKNDIAVDIEISGGERRLDKHREVMVFRGIQDLITHGRDYANASHIQVQLDMSTDAIRILVRDEGRAIDAEALFASDDVSHQDPRSQALLTLREKFDLVGGIMSVTSGDEGTLIRVELPAMD